MTERQWVIDELRRVADKLRDRSERVAELRILAHADILLSAISKAVRMVGSTPDTRGN